MLGGRFSAETALTAEVAKNKATKGKILRMRTL
jgi:hypothetical protein